MDNMKQAINLLQSVEATMDTISVTGIDNQDKFVGCANAVRAVIRDLRAAQQEDAAQVDPITVKEGANG